MGRHWHLNASIESNSTALAFDIGECPRECHSCLLTAPTRERERERTVCNKNHFHRNKWCVDMERRSKQCWRIAFHLSHCFATCFYCWIPYTNLFANASLQNLLSDFLKHSGFGGCSLAANTGLSWVNGCASQRRSCGRQKLSGRIERSVSIG